MEKEDQRNFLIAIVLMLAFVFGYQELVMQPAQDRYAAEQAAAEASTQVDTIEGIDVAEAPAAATLDLPAALAQAERVTFDGPGVDGSIRLKGARIDDLSLRRHYLTVDKQEELRLLRPEEAEHGYYASYYWLDANGRAITGPDADWQMVAGSTLTPSTPIILRYTASGLTIDRTVSMDDNYMFTFSDQITNTSAGDRVMTPYGSIRRHGAYEGFLEVTDPGAAKDNYLVHMGLIGVVDGNLRLRKYKPLFEGKDIKGETDDGLFPTNGGGWWGLTDKYWMGALVPEQARPFNASVNKRLLASGGPLEVRTQGDPLTLSAGQSMTIENRIFAGAKRERVLKTYQEDLGIARMTDAIDWGWAYFLTKPFFLALQWLQGMVGSFGLAILAFTVLVKLPLVPLYNKSYKSMAQMKKLQEPIKEINERFAADPQRKQQEIMALYKKEGANPIGGCLPILMTIPIFYALYKTLLVTLEMRHEPFLWMRDLAAPDPTAIGNLFGLIPWMASADIKAIPIIGIILGIGVLPLLYGITMAGMQSLNPPPPDPTQKMVIQFLPLIFMFVFAGFAGGLVLYWVWSNILSFGQQYFIMKRNGVDTELGKKLGKLLSRNKTEGPAE